MIQTHLFLSALIAVHRLHFQRFGRLQAEIQVLDDWAKWRNIMKQPKV